LAFAVLTLLVLNPNLKRAYLQVRHTLDPEGLIQTDFPSLPLINAQVDRLVAADAGQHSEARLVAKFVLKKINYVSDYENWGNIEYWSTPQETWDKRQEDCDGRAILAASILRSRGFHSARLVVGLDHMWVRVNENEKNPTEPRDMVSLLKPNHDFSLELHARSSVNDAVKLAEALVHPTALRDTGTHLFADIPPVRKAILISALILLCYFPCRYSPGLLVVLALGLGAANLLAAWEPDTGHTVQGFLGGALLVAAVIGASLMRPILRLRLTWHRPSVVRTAAAPIG
jgi:hypothetical protein